MAQKIAHTLNSSENEFQKAMQPLCRTWSSWQVWTDYITMAAIAIANAVDQSGKIHDEREKLYMHTIRQYGEEERFQFPELFRITVDALDRNPEQDFLGELFMALGLGDHWKGQVFTPYPVCKMMAQIDVGHDGHVTDAVQKRGWVGVHDKKISLLRR